MSQEIVRLEIPLDEPLERFNEHIQIEGNHRILFSGRYGTGKTYFLNKYFEDHQDEFYKIHITPTNYVTTPTHDIMQLIKFDIFYQLLLTDNLEFDISEKFSFSLRLWAALNGKDIQSSVFKLMLTILPHLNPEDADYSAIFSGFTSLIEKANEKVKDLAKDDNQEKEVVEQFTKAIIENSQSPYEHDLISNLITRSLESIKVKNKKIALVIDDLDRIDPENIFRILNVFSAYNNYSNEENKFGVDKVIIVCDVNNLKNIYTHRYGKETDFNGYIDKFYTIEVFSFDNTPSIERYIYEQLNPELDKEERVIISAVCVILFKAKKLDLRNLLKQLPDINSIDNQLLLINWETIISKSKYNQEIKYNKIHPAIDDPTGLFISTSNIKLIRAIQKLILLSGDCLSFHNLVTETVNKITESKNSRKLTTHTTEVLWNSYIPFNLLRSKGLGTFFTINNHSMRQAIKFEYPHDVFRSVEYKWVLKWNGKDQYSSNECFLNESSIHFIGSYQVLYDHDLLNIVLEVVQVLDPYSKMVKSSFLNKPIQPVRN